VNVFEPQHVVIGGGLSRAAELFVEQAREEAASRALPVIWERVSLSLARGGADAGVIGAGVLAAQELARSGDTAQAGVE
jgi:predicted NBD/HSP70 family sugar kinase